MGYCFLSELENSEQYFNHDMMNKYKISLDIIVTSQNKNKKGLIEIECPTMENINTNNILMDRLCNNSVRSDKQKKLISIKYKIYQQSTETKFKGTISDFENPTSSSSNTITFPIDESNVKDYSIIVKLSFDDYSTQELHEIFYTQQLLDKSNSDKSNSDKSKVDSNKSETDKIDNSSFKIEPWFNPFSNQMPFTHQPFSHQPFVDFPPFPPFPPAPSLIPFPDSFPITPSTTSLSENLYRTNTQSLNEQPTKQPSYFDQPPSSNDQTLNVPSAFIQIDDYEMLNYSF